MSDYKLLIDGMLVETEGGPAPQAARRRRGDYGVERSGDPHDDQSRAGSARRQHCRSQAGPDHTADYPQMMKTLSFSSHQSFLCCMPPGGLVIQVDDRNGILPVIR